MDMAYVKVYADWKKVTKKLKDAEKGRLIDAMVSYATIGEDHSDSLSGNEQYVFPMFQASIDRDREALAELSKRQSENGKKGGRGNKKATVLEKKPEKPVLFSESQKSEEKEKEKEKEVVVPPYPPTGGTTTASSYVEGNLRSMTVGNWEELRSYLEDGIPTELINHAVDEAVANGKRNWSYVRRILDRYLDEGITTVEQAKKHTSLSKTGLHHQPTDEQLAKKRREEAATLALLRGELPD